MDYDFKSLSDYDFELLVCDLLSTQLGRRVESFRRGRDQGIDLRYATDAKRSAIIQCKHYVNTSFSGLCAAMRKEYQKVKLLCPERYVLVTSQFLTPAEKEILLDILAPFCQLAEDILGGSELNLLLRQHPEVERTHYKLWLTSTAVLEKILHSDIYQQSVILQAEIQSKLRIYVQSEAAYRKAQEMLNQFHCCIISGIPGIGKTTLAEILSICYLDKGYQIIKVRSDINEALRAYQPGRKQVFIYDDFLGSTALEIKSNKNEGKELLSFFGYISTQSGKKFILTTREYILNQARQNDEEFARENFDYKKCVISLEDYTRTDRARILYNHLYFCNISREDIQDLLLDDRVIRLVDHPNYSPRLIETVIKLWSSAKGDSFYHFFSNILAHPNQLWEHAFCRKISPAARDLLLLLCPVQKSISLEELKRRYTGYHQDKAHLENRPLHMTDFTDALRETEGTFIQIDNLQVSYHNPSVRDFIHGYIKENKIEFQLLCKNAADFDFCVMLADLDQTLCREYSEDYTAALTRGAFQEAPSQTIALSERIKQLSVVNRRLKMGEVQGVIQQMLERFVLALEGELEELSYESWDSKIPPRDLKELLETINLFALAPALTDQLFPLLLQYSLMWFNWSCLYCPEDFLVFPALCNIRPVSVEKDAFQNVYHALEDYRDELARDEIQSMDYEGDCEAYLGEVKRVENFFQIDLSSIVSQVEERIFEMEESEKDAGNDDWPEDSMFGNRLNDREILSMFHGLLERDISEPHQF